MQPANQQAADSAQEDSPYQQVIPGIPPHSLYPALAALSTSTETAITPPIPLSRRAINDIEEQQRRALKDTVEGIVRLRRALKDTVEGIVRLTNTLPILDIDEEIDDTPTPGAIQYQNVTQADTGEETLQLESLQEDTGMKTVNQIDGQDIGPTEVQNASDSDEPNVPDTNNGQNEEDGIQEAEENDNTSDSEESDDTVQEDQTSRESQDYNYHSAINDDDLDDTVQFGHLVTEPLL